MPRTRPAARLTRRRGRRIALRFRRSVDVFVGSAIADQRCPGSSSRKMVRNSGPYEARPRPTAVDYERAPSDVVDRRPGGRTEVLAEEPLRRTANLRTTAPRR